jgi:SP family general alpha glucoside:H+ symporter-like MFS transporter
LDAYINHFGYTAADGSKYISADWQAGINNASKGGQIFGLLINGWAQSKYGSRKTYMVGMVVMTLTSKSNLNPEAKSVRLIIVFILVFAVNLPMLLVGNM